MACPGFLAAFNHMISFNSHKLNRYLEETRFANENIEVQGSVKFAAPNDMLNE